MLKGRAPHALLSEKRSFDKINTGELILFIGF